MALPALFQRLVDEEGWVVICDEQRGMEARTVIGSRLLRFSVFRTKDTDTWFVVSAARHGNAWSAVEPRDLAAKIGRPTSDEFEAFNFLASEQQQALSEIESIRRRRRYLEPVLLAPIIPLLVLTLVPPLRESVLGIVAWWTKGPVARLVR